MKVRTLASIAGCSNPSIERTSSGKLHLPAAAAHVERQAPMSRRTSFELDAVLQCVSDVSAASVQGLPVAFTILSNGDPKVVVGPALLMLRTARRE